MRPPLRSCSSASPPRLAGSDRVSALVRGTGMAWGDPRHPVAVPPAAELGGQIGPPDFDLAEPAPPGATLRDSTSASTTGGYA